MDSDPTSYENTAKPALSDAEHCDCKIGRVCRQYEFSEIIVELGRRWIEPNTETSLRQLAEEFDLRVLRTELTDAGMNPLEGEVENLYRLLTADEVSAGNRVQARNRISRYDIDPDELQDNFVSYQTVNRHIKNCLEIKQKPAVEASGMDAEDAISRIRSLQNWMAAVAGKTISQSRKVQDTGSLDVLVDISVTCRECGKHMDPVQVIKNGECRCEDETSISVSRS